MPAPLAPAPVNTALFAKPGESILDYETRLGALNKSQGDQGAGTGFGAPAPIPANLIPGAGAGTSADNSNPDALGAARDAAAKAAGYTDYNDAIGKLTAPSADTTDFYNSAYSAAGLKDLSDKITSRQNDLNTALGKINDNPWLDEASRVGRSKNLQLLANGDIKNWDTLFNSGLKSVHDLVTQHAHDLSATAANNKARLSFLEAQAKASAAQTNSDTKAKNAPPATIKSANGATFQYDLPSGTFKQILPGKDTTTPPSPKTFTFSAKQLTGLQAMGLNSNDANGILKDIQNGHDLESIRQQMKASGLDPGLLDTIMYYVDPAHNTPSKSSGRTV
jgi:hypothetical protein